MGRVLRDLARFIGDVVGASQPGFYPEGVRGVPVPEPAEPPAWTALGPLVAGRDELVIEESPSSTGRRGTRRPPSKARREKP
jgi:hypothetical protein